MIIKVGDLFRISLSENRCAIGHLVYFGKQMGPLIQIFNNIANTNNVVIEDIIMSGYFFPPVITGIKAAIRNGLWTLVGNKQINNFVYPNFINSNWNQKTGEVKNWYLFNGINSILLGPILEEKYKNLEFLVCWSPYDIVYRLETGRIPFPYGEMIEKNKFTPING